MSKDVELFTPEFEQKIIEPHLLLDVLSKAHNLHPLVFTNGCFDILHRGHVTYLAQAKTLGSKLIVALNTDASVKRLGKGEERPINQLINRQAVIASLESVDYVTYFDEDTPYELLEMIKPDILVKGGDWQIADIVGSREVLARGGRVYSVPIVFNTSTTQIINKINNG